MLQHALVVRRYASERPSYDPSTKQISWPLVLLYPEAHHSDFIQNVCEDNTLADYIEVPVEWVVA